MIIINESPNLAEILKSRVELEDIKIFSTKGLLFQYSYKNNKLFVNPRFDSINDIKYLKSLRNSKEEIIIATDFDSTGDLIALELLHLIPGAKRLNIPFDNLINYNILNPQRINRYTDRKFNLDTASLYIREITKESNIYERRLNVFAEIIQSNITEFIIPKNK